MIVRFRKIISNSINKITELTSPFWRVLSAIKCLQLIKLANAIKTLDITEFAIPRVDPPIDKSGNINATC